MTVVRGLGEAAMTGVGSVAVLDSRSTVLSDPDLRLLVDDAVRILRTETPSSACEAVGMVITRFADVLENAAIQTDNEISRVAAQKAIEIAVDLARQLAEGLRVRALALQA